VKVRTKFDFKVLIYLVTTIWQHEYFLNKQVVIEVITNKETENVPNSCLQCNFTIHLLNPCLVAKNLCILKKKGGQKNPSFCCSVT